VQMRCYKKVFIAGLAALAMPLMFAQGGLRFDGKNDRVVIKKSVTDGMTAITFAMWVKGEYKPGNLVTGPIILHFYRLAFALKARRGTGSGYLDWDADVTASRNWRHLTAVWSNPAAGDGRMKLYVDGIKQQNELEYAGGTNGGLGGGSLFLAGRFNHVIGPFKGALEDFRVYNRALTAAEVFAVYRGEGFDGVTNGMLAWYPMKDKNAELMPAGDVVVIRDKSGNGNHGEINGAPAWQNDDAAAQKRREQIGITCESAGRIRSECEKQQQFLAKWLEDNPKADEKLRARFDKLNRGFDRSSEALREYDQLCAEIILKELFPESGKAGK